MRDNSQISIYRPGSPATVIQAVPITPASRRVWRLMEEDRLTLSFNLAVSVDFQVGDYIDDEIFGHFTISEDPVPADYDATTGAYKYTLRFDADWILWKNKVFMLTYNGVRRETTWELTDTLANHLSVLIQNLTALGYTGYSTAIDSDTVPDPTKAVHVSYSGTTILQALKDLASAYECEFWVADKVIHFGKCETGDVIPFSMTDDGGRTINVENIVPSRNDNDYGNRFWVYGSTKNIPETYRKHLEFKADTISRVGGYDCFKDSIRAIYPGMLYPQIVHVSGSPVQETYAGGWTRFSFEEQTYEDGSHQEYSITAIVYTSVNIPVVEGWAISVRLQAGYAFAHLRYELIDQSGNVLTSGEAENDGSTFNYTVLGGVDYVTVRYSFEYKTYASGGAPFTPPDAPTVVVTEHTEKAYFVNVSYKVGNTTNTFLAQLIDGYFFAVASRSGSVTYSSLPSGFTQDTVYTLTEGNPDGIKINEVPISYYTDDYDSVDSVRMLGERRLMLPVGTDYIQTDDSLTRDEIVERVVYFDEIYPRCALRITHVEVGEYANDTHYSDGSTKIDNLPAYILQAERIVLNGTDVDFPFDPDSMMVSGQKLTATFLTPDETKHYSGRVSENACLLMGMTFDVACNRANGVTTYQLAWNTDYGEKLPNEILMPKEGDAFILAGWNAAAMSTLGLIDTAEQELEDTAEEYAELVKEAQFTFDCSMMSDWIVDNLTSIQQGDLPYKKLFPMGQKVKVYHGALAAGYLISRIIGFEYKLDIPYDTPIYTVGETEAYSRLKEIEKSLHAQTQSTSSSSNTTTVNMSGGSSSESAGGKTLHLVPGTMDGMSSVDYNGSEEKSFRVPSVVDHLVDGAIVPRIADDGQGNKILVDKDGNQVAGKQFFELVQDVQDPTKFSVRLKPEYTGLWADGWMAAGGVGSGSGGGGGIVDNVHPQADLEGQPVTSEDLTETYSAYAIQSIYNAVKQLQQSTPDVSLVNGANNSTLTVNGTSADFYTKTQVDAIVGAVYRPAGNASTVSELGSLTAANIGKVYNMTASFTTTADFLEGAGKTFPAGTNVVIVQTGTNTYKYDVLSGFVDLSGYAQKVSGATNGHFAGLDANGNLTDSGHSHADYVTALGTSGNYLTWTKNGTTNNITVPFATKATTATKLGSATVGHSHRPIYLSSGTPTQVTDVGMDFIGWPYANHGTFSSLDNLYYNVGPNILAYPAPAYIDCEYSNDGGVTWVDYGCTDSQKRAIFTTSGDINAGKKGSSGVTTDDCARITIHVGIGAYGKCEFLVFRHYFAGYCTVKIEYTTYADPTTYVEHTTLTNISGNPGYRVIPFSKFIFGNNGVHDIRITWQYSGTTYKNYTYSISSIRAYCSNVYSTNSTLASTNRVYSIDENLNATFPAAIYANANGLSLGSTGKRWNIFATKVTVGQANNNSSYISSDSATNIYLNNSAGAVLVADGKVVRRGTSLSDVTLGSSTYPWGGLYSTTGSFTGAVTLGSTLSVADAITLSGSTASARRIYFGDANHYLELDSNGFHFVGAGLYTDSWMAAGGIGEGGGSGSVAYLNDLTDVTAPNPSNGDLLSWNGTAWVNVAQSTITPDLSAYALKVGGSDYEFKVSKLMFANSGHADSYLSVGAINPGEQRPLWTYSQAALIQGQPDVIESVYLALYDDIPEHLPNPYALTFGSKTYDGSAPKTITASDLGALTTETDPTVPSWAKQTSKPSYSLTEISGTSDLQAIEALTGTSGLLKKTDADTWALDTTNYLSSHQTIYALTLQAGIFSAGTYTPNSAAKTINIPTTLDHISDGTNVKYSDFVHITGAETITGAKTFSADLTLSENLVMGAAKHIDIGPVRIEYDSVNQAVHVTTNLTGNDAPAIGLYVDGFLAAGGIGTSGGGGGYGLEQITTNQDGTVDFHFTGGDVTTIDLNHEHPQYPKYVHLASESEMPASPDPYTMYIIDGSGGGGGGSYTLPAATSSALGGVKIGFSQTGKSYPVALDANSKAYVELPTAIVYLTSESQMPASPDSNTLYVILDTTT